MWEQLNINKQFILCSSVAKKRGLAHTTYCPLCIEGMHIGMGVEELGLG